MRDSDYVLEDDWVDDPHDDCEHWLEFIVDYDLEYLNYASRHLPRKIFFTV